MLIGQDGPLTPAQEQKLTDIQQAEARDTKERARIAKLSKKNLVREIRREIRTTGANNSLAFCYGKGLLILLGERLDVGHDPYRRTYPKTPKRTRTRGKATVTTSK